MSRRGGSLQYSDTLIIEECCSCGIAFAMPKSFQQQCLDRPGVNVGKGFYCPNGHVQWYTGPSEAKKQAERAKRAEEQAAYWRDQMANEQMQHQATKRRERAQKAAKTRIKNRVSKGVCPCCNRSFANLRRHMTTQHPDYTNEE
jgi:hypothetical protein